MSEPALKFTASPAAEVLKPRQPVSTETGPATGISALKNIEARREIAARIDSHAPGQGLTNFAYGKVVGLVPFKAGLANYGNVLDNNQARTAFLKPFNEMLKSASYIQDLKDGWDDGEGYAPGTPAFNLVKRWVKEAARVLFDHFSVIELAPPDIDPTPSGCITIFWRLPHGKFHATVSVDPTVKVTFYLETKSASGQVIDAKKGTYYDSYRFQSDLPPLLGTAAGAIAKNRWINTD